MVPRNNSNTGEGEASSLVQAPQRLFSQSSFGVPLQYAIAEEKLDLKRSFFTLKDRLTLCIEIMKSLEALHRSGVFLGGSISLADIMPQKFLHISLVSKGQDKPVLPPDTIHRVDIRIPAHANKSPKAKNFPGWEEFPTVIWEKDLIPGKLDAKTDVCLFGRIFLEIWRFLWLSFEQDALTDLVIKGELSGSFLAMQDMPSNERDALIALLKTMNAPQKEDRPTVTEVIGKLQDIANRLNHSAEASLSEGLDRLRI